ncbi:TPA: hypothetical protein N0F65_012262 [Lagenidium giganteum]|uniref:Uncharacterized protein n=1 Tax=Lagenidium giganteum TaxID=4803 RepID=A0AAV2ZJ01_9STRA|nr:TPA: hypothetical protein N0F65_012262 [Lagenidium giganteum]
MQPEEEAVLSEISRVLETEPEMGAKRVAAVLKESNPEWTLGEKRGTHSSRGGAWCRARLLQAMILTRTMVVQWPSC